MQPGISRPNSKDYVPTSRTGARTYPIYGFSSETAIMSYAFLISWKIDVVSLTRKLTSGM